MRYFTNLLKVRNVVSGIANGLDIDGLGIVIDQGLEVLGIIALDKFGLDAQSWKEDLHLVVRAPIQVRRGNDVVACVCQSGKGHALR